MPAFLGKQLNDEDPMVPSVVETGPMKDKKQNEENQNGHEMFIIGVRDDRTKMICNIGKQKYTNPQASFITSSLEQHCTSVETNTT